LVPPQSPRRVTEDAYRESLRSNRHEQRPRQGDTASETDNQYRDARSHENAPITTPAPLEFCSHTAPWTGGSGIHWLHYGAPAPQARKKKNPPRRRECGTPLECRADLLTEIATSPSFLRQIYEDEIVNGDSRPVHPQNSSKCTRSLHATRPRSILGPPPQTLIQGQKGFRVS